MDCRSRTIGPGPEILEKYRPGTLQWVSKSLLSLR
jgi:hypothetical protein